ncbi:MAG: chloride channel protein [Myxococcales bacterium]|nr:chloride channel protein [Myxococcales bacterium]
MEVRWIDHVLPPDRAQRIGRLILLCALVGVVTGLGAVAFDWSVQFGKHVLMDGVAGYRPAVPAGDAGRFGETNQPFRPWVLFLLPVLGGFVGGLIIYWFAPEAEGHGTDAAIDAYHNRQGAIRPRVPPIKALASAITLATGGSAGREGPIAHIGAGFGSIVGRVLRLGVEERRLLMVAGLAAGIGAIFRSPLAAALFAAEVLYREMDMEFEVIVPAVIASIVAYSVFTIPFGADPLFSTPSYVFESPLELFPYLLLALAVAAGAKVYVRFFYRVHTFFKAMKVPTFVKPVMGGAVVGSFAFFLPEALGSGYGIVQDAINQTVTLKLLGLVVLGKIVTTAFTVGSGQSGGVFGPSMVIGAAIGGVVGRLCDTYMPGLSAPEGAFVVVGMAGFFAAAANTPISTIIMVSEITGSYQLLVPTMWVCIIAFMLVRRSTLYRGQVDRRSASPVHLHDMLSDVLARYSVRDALGDPEHERAITVESDLPLPAALSRLGSSRHAILPVVDANARLVGVINAARIRQMTPPDAEGRELVAADIMEGAIPYVVMGDNLYSAMHKMVTSHKEEIVVVDDADPTRVVGTLSRSDLIATYDHQLSRSDEEPLSKGTVHVANEQPL